MADLKNIDADVLTQTIRKAAEESKAEIDRRVQAALTEVEETARAWTSLPPTISDLIATAEVVLVRELGPSDVAPYRTEANQMNVLLQFDGANGQSMCEWERRPHIKPGRYRAIFVLLPIGEKK
jgi:hypothetical protein